MDVETGEQVVSYDNCESWGMKSVIKFPMKIHQNKFNCSGIIAQSSEFSRVNFVNELTSNHWLLMLKELSHEKLSSWNVWPKYFKLIYCNQCWSFPSLELCDNSSISVSVILSFSGVYNGPDRTGLAVDSQTGPNIATCCCVNGRGLSMFDLRMPLPMDFIYDVSFFVPVAICCTEHHSI